MFAGCGCLEYPEHGVWEELGQGTRVWNLDYQAEESRANMGSREPRRVCEQGRAMASAVCVGRVGS